VEPIRLDLRYHLPAAPERVWPILADTERLNRRLGLPPTQATAIGGEPVRVARVKARMMGIALEWDEEPFEFVEGRYYWERRRMLRGPIREFNGGLRFFPLEDGTEVRIESEFLPANLLGELLIQALCRKTRADADRMIAGVRAHLAGKQEAPYGPGVDAALPSVRDATLERLRSARKELLQERLAPWLCEYIASAGDAELTRIRPFALARKWSEDRYEVLRLCLRAAYCEVLDLSWDLLCPNCRGAKSRWSHLEQVRSVSHCDDCQITFDAQFDRAVEATFRPNPNYRRIEEMVYCSGGPRNTPHIIAQMVLEPGEVWSVEAPIGPGRYRLRNLPGDQSATLFAEQDSGSALLDATYLEGGLRVQPESCCVTPGLVQVRLENQTKSRQQAILERMTGYEDVATAAVVSVHQEFRDLFSSEVLSPTTQLQIRTLPLMFTDLQGSTTLYSRLGDAPAYVLVRDHFQLLQERVAKHGGGIVKTIGDAVMAAFPTAADAVACALAVREELDRFNESAPEPLRLKMGLHQGPCIAVRAYDDRLDYFGSTVNLAARTHGESHGDDVVITEAILGDPAAAELLASVRQEPFEADLRGIGKVRLVRLRPG
jgi:class 3 adenylate cyclase